MYKTIPFLEKTRHKIFDDIKQEDIDYVKANSRKLKVDLFRRKKTEDPWLKCFYYRSDEMRESSLESLHHELNKDQKDTSLFEHYVATRRGLTAEEILFFKNSMIKEACARKLPNLTLKHDELRSVYGKYHDELKEYFLENDNLYEDVSNSMANLEESATCLENLEDNSKISITADMTEEEAVDSITRMNSVMQSLLHFGNSLIKDASEALESFEKIRELEEERDAKTFDFAAHFLPYLFNPKVKKRKYTSPGWLTSWKVESYEELLAIRKKKSKTAKLPIRTSKRCSLL